MAEFGNLQVEVGPPKFAGLPASQSVIEIFKKLEDLGPVTSWEVVRALLELHPEYGKGLGKDLLIRPVESQADLAYISYEGETRTVREWLDAVAALYDPALEFLDDRLVIIGLSIIDRNLEKFIASRVPNFIDILKQEGEENWQKTFEELLIRPGSEPESETKPDQEPTPPPHPPSEYDPAVQHDDSPAQKDVLGRSGFAEALAIWLTRLWEKNRPKKGSVEKGNSFVMNIYGPWGSGKSSLLNLLKIFLQPPASDQSQASERVQNWIVIEFNAWQHQHLTPVWWPLLDQIYQQGVEKLASKFREDRTARKIRLWEYRWRLLTGRKLYLFTLLGCVLALVLLFIWPGFRSATVSAQSGKPGAPGSGLTYKELLEIIVKILAILGTVWSGTLALTRSLLPGSVSSAEMFQQFTRDPLEKVKQHYHDLINKFNYPVMVFIDDLDRCQPNYVVKLLEGIQTLFNSSKVFYVIAADRRWLHKCFEIEYQSLVDSVLEPGRRMGHLFLEKVFQLAVPVPRLSQPYQKVYLDYLIMGDKSGFDQSLEEARKLADKEFEEARSQEEIIDRLQSSPKISSRREQESLEKAIVDQARREAAIRQSASQEVEASTEYYLRKFAPLLEPNPRAMKRLVTAYGIYRAQAMHENLSLIATSEKRDQFVLWIIIRLRWPSLEEYLMKNPDKIEVLNLYYEQKVGIDAMDAELKPFATNQDVEQVLNPNINKQVLNPNINDDVKKGVKLDKDVLSGLIMLS